jgi:thiol-disulfide isomerase/thioredoxin
VESSIGLSAGEGDSRRLYFENLNIFRGTMYYFNGLLDSILCPNCCLDRTRLLFSHRFLRFISGITRGIFSHSGYLSKGILRVTAMSNSEFSRRQLLLYLSLGVAGAGSATVLKQLQQNKIAVSPENPNHSPLSSLEDVAQAAPRQQLPEFQGISQWLNSSPLTISSQKGKVVLIQFWTFSCINCQRTLPYIVQWHQKYAPQGLQIIGVHTPEFAFERDANNVKKALKQYKITYPVPMDNAFKTWNVYQNRYWPNLYLADRQGVLRYSHAGEGAYDTTEQTIRQLLG